jgi:hypothetical protein
MRFTPLFHVASIGYGRRGGTPNGATTSSAWRTRSSVVSVTNMVSPSASSTASGGGGAKFENPKIVAKPINDYVLKVGFNETPIAQELRLVTTNHPRAIMMGDPVEAAFFQVLLPAIGAKKVLEVGVFTGYTTLVMAEAIAQQEGGGTIVALDINDDYVSIGKPYWEKAGVHHMIDLRNST